jgi:hypothetical protein
MRAEVTAPKLSSVLLRRQVSAMRDGHSPFVVRLSAQVLRPDS